MRKELTLEETIEMMTNRHLDNIAKTNEYIEKLTNRKANAIGSEIERYQKLIDLHTTHLAELNATDIITVAQDRFDKQQEKIKSLSKPLNI